MFSNDLLDLQVSPELSIRGSCLMMNLHSLLLHAM